MLQRNLLIGTLLCGVILCVLANDSTRIANLRKEAFSLYGKDAKTMSVLGLQMMDIAKKANLSEGIAASHNIIALSSLSVSDYQKSLAHFLDALRIYEELEDGQNKANILSNIGVVYYYLGEHENSLEYHENAYNIRKILNDSSALSKSLNNLGVAYKNLGQYNEAIDFYLKANAIKQKLNDINGVSNTLNNIGRIYLINKEASLALDFFKQSLALDSSQYNLLGTATSLLNIGEAYTLMEEFGKAKSHLIRAIKLAEEIGALQVQMLAHKHISSIYSQQGNYRNALQATESFIQLNDSINGVQSKREIADLEARYENDQVIIENALLTEQNQSNALKLSKQRTIIIFILVIIILLIIATSYIYRNYKYKARLAQIERDKNKHIKKLNNQISERNTELRLLNDSKNKLLSVLTHDIKAPFNDVRSMISLISNGSISDAEFKEFMGLLLKKTDAVGDMIFNMLDWVKTQMDGLNVDLTLNKVKPFVDKELSFYNDVASEKGIALINSIDEEMTSYCDKNLMNVILRNLIGNAIKFTDKGGKIEVSEEINEGKIWLAISDSGVGISESELEKIYSTRQFTKPGTHQEQGSGLGLMLVKEFVIKQGGLFKVTSRPGVGSKFMFSMPLEAA